MLTIDFLGLLLNAIQLPSGEPKGAICSGWPQRCANRPGNNCAQSETTGK